MKRSTRRWLVPEALQTSSMDCGVTALRALLEGHGLRVNHARLREACQTTLDGTSFDTVEDVTNQLGLEAEQVVIPVDHFLEPAARCLPSLLFLQLPSGMTHIVVCWRRHGPLLQLMDPGRGRMWVRFEDLRPQLFIHRMAAPAAAWREFAGSDDFLDALRGRMRKLGIARERAEALVRAGLADEGWRALATLDAAVRMAAALVARGRLAKGAAASDLVASAVTSEPPPALDVADFPLDRPGRTWPEPLVPLAYWSVFPAAASAPADVAADAPDGDGEAQLIVQGMVAIRVLGRRAPDPEHGHVDETVAAELEAALREPPARPLRELARLVRQDGLAAPLTMLAALATTLALALATVALVPALLATLHHGGASVWAHAASLAAVVLVGRVVVDHLGARVGRTLEQRLRAALYERLPHLSDRYYATRPSVGLAWRTYDLHRIRDLPAALARPALAVCEIALAAAAIAWHVPAVAPAVLLSVAAGAALHLGTRTLLGESESRASAQRAASSRFMQAAVRAPIPLRAHGAGPRLFRAQEEALAAQVESSRRHARLTAGVRAAGEAIGLALLAAVVLADAPLAAAWWAALIGLRLFDVARATSELAALRGLVGQLMEPLAERAAPEPAATDADGGARDVSMAIEEGGAAIAFEGVHLRAGAQHILRGVDLALAPGEKVAVVGPSGAGKTSLVGILLGWNAASEGRLVIDGAAATPARHAALRRTTAWIDPAVHLFDRSVADNVRYGVDPTRARPLATALDEALAGGLADKLGDAPIGENGAALSGGESQRLRMARALARSDVRLVVLDEPFRGLDRERRHALLARAKATWPRATFIAISHDLELAATFERVVVLEDGAVVEDGAPEVLVARAGSRFAAMLEAERKTKLELLAGAGWRRIVIDEAGRIGEAREAPLAKGGIT